MSRVQVVTNGVRRFRATANVLHGPGSFPIPSPHWTCPTGKMLGPPTDDPFQFSADPGSVTEAVLIVPGLGIKTPLVPLSSAPVGTSPKPIVPVVALPCARNTS